MEQYEGHAESQEEDRQKRPHNDQHRSLARGYPCMAQKHQLCYRSPCGSRSQQGQEVIAEDNLHRLIETDLLIGNLHQMHQPAAIEEHAQSHGPHRQGYGPGLEAVQVLQGIYIYGGVDDYTGNYQNQQDKGKEPAVKLIHAKAPSCLSQPKVSSWLA